MASRSSRGPPPPGLCPWALALSVPGPRVGVGSGQQVPPSIPRLRDGVCVEGLPLLRPHPARGPCRLRPLPRLGLKLLNMAPGRRAGSCRGPPHVILPQPSRGCILRAERLDLAPGLWGAGATGSAEFPGELSRTCSGGRVLHALSPTLRPPVFPGADLGGLPSWGSPGRALGVIAYEIWSVCGEPALSFLDTGASWELAGRGRGDRTSALPAATVGCVHTDPGRIRSGPGSRPAELPACMVSPVGFQWELRVHRLAWAHTRVPGRLGACLQKEPQDRLPQMLEVEVLEGACWDQVPHCTDGKTEGLAGEGSPRVCGARRMTLAGAWSGFLVGRQLRLKAYGGPSPHVTSGGSRLAQQPGGLCRWAEGWGEMAAWVGRAESG